MPMIGAFEKLLLNEIAVSVLDLLKLSGSHAEGGFEATAEMALIRETG